MTLVGSKTIVSHSILLQRYPRRLKSGIARKKNVTVNYPKKERSSFRYFLGIVFLLSLYFAPLYPKMRKGFINSASGNRNGMISLMGKRLNHSSKHMERFFYVSSLSPTKETSSLSFPSMDLYKSLNIGRLRIQRSIKREKNIYALESFYLYHRKSQGSRHYSIFDKRNSLPCFLNIRTSFLGPTTVHKEKNLIIKGVHDVAFSEDKGEAKKSRPISCSEGTTPLRIIFLGTPDVAASSLKYLLDTSVSNRIGNDLQETKAKEPIFEIVGVVSQPPAPVGRKRVLTNSPVHDLVLQVNENDHETENETASEKLGRNEIPVLTPVKANEADFLESLLELQPDICITAAYGNFLPTKFLKIPKLGTINIHPSLLPKYRGASPVQRCLENGDEVTGVSVLYTVLKMDAGPIIYQSKRLLSGDEKTSTLLPELFIDGAKVLVDTILPQLYQAKAILHSKENKMENDTKQKNIDLKDEERFSLLSNVSEQDENFVTHADKITKEEGLCLFSEETATKIHNKVRAFDIWPGTWGLFEIFEEITDEQQSEVEEKENKNENNHERSKKNLKIEDIKRVKLITTKLIREDSSSNSLHTMIKNYMQHDRECNRCTSSLFLIENPTKKKQKHLIVRCADETYLELVEVQLEGKKPMQGKDWWNGLRGKCVRYTR